MKPGVNRRTVLLIKLGSLGDVIQASYAAYELKEKGFRVLLLTSISYATCFPDVDYISCSIPKEFVETTTTKVLKQQGATYRKSIRTVILSPQPRFDKLPIAGLAKFKDYHTVVDLDGFPGSMILTAVLKKNFNLKTIGWFDRIDYLKEHLTTFAGIDREIYDKSYDFTPDDSKHGTARYRSLLLRAGILAGRWKRPDALFSYLGHSRGVVQRRIAIQMVTSTPEKDWPPENFAKLLDRLQCTLKGKTELILLGEKDNENQQRAARELIHLLPQRSDIGIRDLITGRYDYASQAGELQVCDYLIGCDSSWGHMAAALGVKTFTIFGYEANPDVYRPWPTRKQAECVPVGEKDEARTISVQQVLQKILSLPRHLKLG